MPSLPRDIEIVPSSKRAFAPFLVALSICGLLADLAAAEIWSAFATTREVTTLSTQAHPKKIELAYVVMERMTIAEVSLEYRLDRWNWCSGCGIDLRDGGKMVAALRRIREDGAEAIGKKQKSSCESGVTETGFGSVNERVCGVYWEEELELEPGDLLVWTVKFKRMPDLEHEPFADSVYRDRFTLAASLLPPY